MQCILIVYKKQDVDSFCFIRTGQNIRIQKKIPLLKSMKSFEQIISKPTFNKNDLVVLLKAEGYDKDLLFKNANEVKLAEVGNKIYFRGLVEFSNVCSKDCFYCGIRNSNTAVSRYNLSDIEIIEAARFAYKNNYGSLVLQSGELSSPTFTLRVENLLRQIKALSNNELGVTLSLGEQPEEVYQRWFEAGAHRYLLRIETSNPVLYRKIHPLSHSFQQRLNCLHSLKKLGYQTGTGVMIGLPFQTIDDLANDLLFMQQFDIDMVGMGPYIEHAQTPLYQFKNELWSINERFIMALKMIAVLRLLMKDINIVASTALQAIDPLGREKAVHVGANVIMPNITPGPYRNHYALYENKPCADQNLSENKACSDALLSFNDSEIGFGQWGDSKHFLKKKKLK